MWKKITREKNRLNLLKLNSLVRCDISFRLAQLNTFCSTHTTGTCQKRHPKNWASATCWSSVHSMWSASSSPACKRSPGCRRRRGFVRCATWPQVCSSRESYWLYSEWPFDRFSPNSPEYTASVDISCSAVCRSEWAASDRHRSATQMVLRQLIWWPRFAALPYTRRTTCSAICTRWNRQTVGDLLRALRWCQRLDCSHRL